MAAVIGALSVMALIVYVSQKVKGNVTLLIIGVMIGYVASAGEADGCPKSWRKACVYSI